MYLETDLNRLPDHRVRHRYNPGLRYCCLETRIIMMKIMMKIMMMMVMMVMIMTMTTVKMMIYDDDDD